MTISQETCLFVDCRQYLRGWGGESGASCCLFADRDSDPVVDTSASSKDVFFIFIGGFGGRTRERSTWGTPSIALGLGSGQGARLRVGGSNGVQRLLMEGSANKCLRG